MGYPVAFAKQVTPIAGEKPWIITAALLLPEMRGVDDLLETRPTPHVTYRL